MSDLVQDFIEETRKVRQFSFDVEHNPEVGLHQKDFDLHGCSFSNGRK
jgi:hypothetical protein